MKKRILSLCIASVMAMSVFTACNSNGSSSTTTLQPEETTAGDLVQKGEYAYEQELNIIDDNYRNYYEIFVYSFYDSDGNGTGDLNGVTQKLDYIKQFADIVWVNPVYKSPFRDGGYDVQDYYQIDEKFGTMEDVEELTREAHARGMKVLFDLVVGHTSDQHQWFLESQKAEPNEYSDYYVWNDDVFGWCPPLLYKSL